MPCVAGGNTSSVPRDPFYRTTTLGNGTGGSALVGNFYLLGIGVGTSPRDCAC